MKAAVANLPAKVEVKIGCQLTPHQEWWYKR
jgi:hypothetical protein